MTAGRITARQRKRLQAEKEWNDRRARVPSGSSHRIEEKQDDRLRAPELIRALERMHTATGDPVFDDALRAMKAYGFDRHGLVRGAKVAQEAAYGPPDHGFLVQMRFNVERRGETIPEAAENIAAEFGAPGHSFDATTQRLEEGFREWRKANFAEPDPTPPGDLGYSLRVYPAEGDTLELFPGEKITRVGAVRPADSFWRRLFRDGSILIKYEREK
ncbi:hypothetical protein P7D22_04790 [Lichenihabitans sp. Uapishka_5]|uniref:hypothetical protein n=1 Tax=Lichenihabitans sp. Uapishka_5 TaxID=3037302 RepID=UPI0029E8072D|nr:hypothetical protein [Lichenihabitans sp. Uapishka_5]MDX7950496.1 hypothetical protein [Lichenihabitans sp. Uapishka_5]